MASWKELKSSAPQLAEWGEKLLFWTGDGSGMLTTVNGDLLPRTHPVNVGLVDDRLLVFVRSGSAKTRDLQADGRYSLAAYHDPHKPHEFVVRGHAILVEDSDTREQAARNWAFDPGGEYLLYELQVTHVIFGERESPDVWPPRYTTWRSR
ncbi:MAG TPA: pyridoxamine 5'-phosphate oxidase family protein [Acidimicrobiia bacterium]|nr:pyridoxamine 5'-phosphate oxidase family protein [Acidimicrobiia bacterium]